MEADDEKKAAVVVREFFPPTGPQIGNPGRRPSRESSPQNASHGELDFDGESASNFGGELDCRSSSKVGLHEMEHIPGSEPETPSAGIRGSPPPSDPAPTLVKDKNEEAESNLLSAPEPPGAIIPVDTGTETCALMLPGSLHSNRLPRRVMKGQHFKVIRRPLSAQSALKAQGPQVGRERLAEKKTEAHPVRGIRARLAVTNLAGASAARSMRRTAACRGDDILEDPLSNVHPVSRAGIEDLKLKAGRSVQVQNKLVNLVL